MILCPICGEIAEPRGDKPDICGTHYTIRIPDTTGYTMCKIVDETGMSHIVTFDENKNIVYYANVFNYRKNGQEIDHGILIELINI